MVAKKDACEECARTCQLLHWSKRDLEPRVSRFFKIMIGPDFNEALFLPPKFAKNVKELVGQETKLEDSRGICWSVTLSYYKDLPAFHKGWYEFSVDKDLKVGDFLVFSHIKGGHFVVHAFGRDGCEKLNAARKHPPAERARTSGNIAAESTPCQTTSEEARKRKSSRTSVEIQPIKTNCTSNCEVGKGEQLCLDNELYLLVDRDAGYVQSDYRTWLYDLSSFEMQQNICSADKNEELIHGQEVSPDVAQKSLKHQSHGNLEYKNTNEIVISSMETGITTNTNIVGNSKDSGAIHNMSVERHNVHLDYLPSDHPLSATSVRLAVIEADDASNVAVLPQSPNRNGDNLPQSPQNRSSNLRTPRLEFTFTHVSLKSPLQCSKREMDMVKKVKVEIREGTYGCGQKRALQSSSEEEDGNSFAASEMNKAVKIVPVDSLAVPSTVATSVTCLAEANGSAYIDLPDCWPSVTFPSNGEGSATVILEDPEGREWGGIYYENFGFRVLVVPWYKVNEKNGIQPGDHLVFSLADASLNKYKFNIVRKRLEN